MLRIVSDKQWLLNKQKEWWLLLGMPLLYPVEVSLGAIWFAPVWMIPRQEDCITPGALGQQFSIILGMPVPLSYVRYPAPGSCLGLLSFWLTWPEVFFYLQAWWVLDSRLKIIFIHTSEDIGFLASSATAKTWYHSNIWFTFYVSLSF